MTENCKDCQRKDAALLRVYALMDTVRRENRDPKSWVLPWSEEAADAFALVAKTITPGAALAPAATEPEREVQWWLASLNQHGNAKLEDGPHSERSGCVRAVELMAKLHTGANYFGRPIGKPPEYGWAIARVELEPVRDPAPEPPASHD